jgi:anti-sigma factor RsiW
MTRDHLSDEAIAAIADDVLTGHARERARRHISRCPECNYAVAVQREAVWALRAAPAPSLPSGLMDRLRDVPVTTPVTRVPTTVDDNGTAMFATVAAPAAALVPTKPADRTRRSRALTVAVASAAAVTVIAGGVVAVEYGSTDDSGTTQPAHVRSVPGSARLGDAQLAGVMAPMHW